MFTLRLAMVISFIIITLNCGSFIDPNGRGLRSTITSDQGGGLDPAGASHASSTTPDAGPRIDPEG
jgi:hypothetical protein